MPTKTLSKISRSIHQKCSIKIHVLKNFSKVTGKHMCQSHFFNKVTGLKSATSLKKRALAQVFSCEFCEIFKNTFFTEHLWMAASEHCFTHDLITTMNVGTNKSKIKSLEIGWVNYKTYKINNILCSSSFKKFQRLELFALCFQDFTEGL